MEVVKAYVNERDEATIRCSACGRKKTANVRQYRDMGKKLKVTCPCEATFLVSFEMRQYYRKPLILSGEYSKDGTDKHARSMLVVDVSLGGVGIRTLHDHDLKVDDIIRVTFELDDGQQSPISRNAIVRKINGRAIGAEFCDNKIDKALAFYVLP
jgi:hypothetical protein